MTTALKIGILTFHRCINYGSYWQARCLAEGLQARGHQAVILDHVSPRVNIAEWKCAFRPELPLYTPEEHRPLYREKIQRFFKAFETLPLSAPLPLHQPEQMDAYDLVLVGSDEVWNLFHPWYSGNRIFYGDGVNAKMLVSYAASFGNFPASQQLSAEWTNRLRNFDMISVRDDNAKDIIEKNLGFTPGMVLDPCLQFPQVMDTSNQRVYNGDYVAVYGHNSSPFFIQQIRTLARQRNLQLVSIGYRNDWADQQWIAAGPLEFADFMAHATAVATNFFHGCVFALRNQKPFVCETSPYRSNKLNGLMKKIGGLGHLVNAHTPEKQWHHKMEEPLQPEIRNKIDHLRHTSDAFLDKALALKQYQYA